MIQENLLNVLEKILKVTAKEDVPVMFMGGIAVSLWGQPRATYDIDGVIGISTAEADKFLSEVSKENFSYDRKKPVKIIQGFAFITLVYPIKSHKIYIDLFLTSDKYQEVALSRRKEIVLSGKKIPVISAEDLILYKLLAGRTKDIEDVREILIAQKGKLNMRYMKKWAKELGVTTFLSDELNSLKYDYNS